MSEELIRRSDAIEAIYEARRAMPLKGVFTDTMSWAIARANAIPTIEAVPKDFHDKTCEAMAKRHTEEIQKLMPKRGKWIDNRDASDKSQLFPFECSECHDNNERATNFCPNCGADMREREDE